MTEQFRFIEQAQITEISLHEDGSVGAGYEVISSRLHNCRAEPHCTCDHNSWYHRDVDEGGMQSAAECGMDGCPCKSYVRCHTYVPDWSAITSEVRELPGQTISKSPPREPEQWQYDWQSWHDSLRNLTHYPWATALPSSYVTEHATPEYVSFDNEKWRTTTGYLILAWCRFTDRGITMPKPANVPFGPFFKGWREDRAIAPERLATLLGIHPRSIARLESETQDTPEVQAITAKLQELQRKMNEPAQPTRSQIRSIWR